MEQELLILGLLKQGPKHPYQIKRLIKDVIFTFAPFENVSIYYPLRKMEEEGWVVKKSIRSGQRPQRYVYSITKQGEEEFRRLLDKSFLTIKRPFFNIDLSLYFMPYVEKAVAHRRLRGRLTLFKNMTRNLAKLLRSLDNKKSYHLILILEHNLELANAEIKFLERLVNLLG
jgi:DNA-binding PadR family transcriptional regulator